jgi:hypothetical protein
MMARRIETVIDIAAPASAVWRVLMDFTAYPDWNPMVRSIAGNPRRGEQLKVCIQPPGKSEMRFRPRVQVADEQRVFSWLGHFLLSGLFDGLHEFRLQPVADGTRFYHRESFSGLLLPLIWPMMEAPTRAGFEAMNQALKTRAEALKD